MLFENNYLNLLFNPGFSFCKHINIYAVNFFGVHNILFEKYEKHFHHAEFLGDFVFGCTITYNKTGLPILSKHRQQ